MTINEFAELAASEALLDVLLVVATVDMEIEIPRFSMPQGGPIFLQFEHRSVILEQPPGREEISITEIDPVIWLAARPRDEDYNFALVAAFNLFCYRRNSFDPPPTINSILGYSEAGTASAFRHLILKLSTGGIIGVDSTSEEGLRYFLDSQKAIFVKEVATPGHLDEQEIWSRFPRNESNNAGCQ